MKPIDVHAAVQSLLMEHGSYEPLELLLGTGLLDYQHYRAWRCGERPTLDSALGAGSAAAEDVLQTAAEWATRLGLQSEISEPCGWEHSAGVVRVASSNPRLHTLLCTWYRAPASGAQLDLFADSAETIALGALLDALVEQDRARAAQAVDRLAALSPGHRYLDGARSLIAALAAPTPSGAGEAAVLLKRIEHDWLPAANAMLGARSRDLLAPVWRAVAVAMEGEAFDPDQPRRHASWVFGRCLDWRGVRRSVLALAGYRQQPVLVARLADAERRLGARAAAIELWFELCWAVPETFRQSVEARGFADWALVRAWTRAKAEDLDPELTPEWFPAWMLLEEPGLARMLPASGREDPPAGTYDVLRRLLRDRDRQVEDHIGLRRALQRNHPGLLARYLEGLNP
jgi:hypothetical protein